MDAMNISLKKMLARAETWSEEDREELAQASLEIEARRHGNYQATEEELKPIDEGLAAVERGDIASEEEVEALFAKYRRV
jgi:predicted transcriptional regulator